MLLFVGLLLEEKHSVWCIVYYILFKNTQGWFNGYDVQTRSSTWWNTYPSNFEDTNQIQLDSSSTGKASKYKFDEETLQNGFFEFGWCAGLWWNDLTLSRNSRYVWHYPFKKSGEVIYGWRDEYIHPIRGHPFLTLCHFISCLKWSNLNTM